MAIQTVTVTINGSTHNLTYNDSNGAWESVLTAPSTSSFSQPDHKYGVSVTATDDAGNSTTVDRDDASGTLDLALRVIEKVAPTITITSPGADAILTNNQPTFTIQLRDNDSGVDVETLVIKIDGTPQSDGIETQSVSGGVDVTFTPTTALPDGARTITVDVSDNDGNAATSASRTVTIDTVPPTLDVTSPADGLITNQINGTVAGTTNDTTSSPVTVTITVNDNDVGPVSVGSDGAFSVDVTYQEGANTVVVTATDSAGKSTSVTRNVTVNTTAPQFDTITLAPNPVDAGQTYVISVTFK